MMIDDLTSRGVTEPYRMFTSRAEFRLSLRADNADQRLTPIGLDLGCVSDARRESFNRKRELLEKGRALLEGSSFTPSQLNELGIQVSQDGMRRTAFAVMASGRRPRARCAGCRGVRRSSGRDPSAAGKGRALCSIHPAAGRGGSGAEARRGDPHSRGLRLCAAIGTFE